MQPVNCHAEVVTENQHERGSGPYHQQPQDPDLRVVLAESYLQVERYAQALEQADQVLRQYPKDASAALIAGIAQVAARLIERHQD